LHVEALPKILEECKTYFPFLKAIAVTNAPGLAVTLMEGVTMAKALSLGLNVPLIAVNHLKGHIYSLFIDQEVVFPMMVLLVSGGHTQVIEVENLNQMQVLAKTIDDSFGESFDKVAKMLNLGYPGGPIVQEYALKGDENKYELPIPLSQSAQVAFSYSGLKNAVRLTIEKEEELTLEVKQNICASFQKTAVAHIMQKMKKLFKQNPPKHFAIVGGASANIHLRTQIEQLCQQYNTTLHLSQLQYCSDNAAMIGRVAVEQYKAGDFTAVDELDVFSRTSL